MDAAIKTCDYEPFCCECKPKGDTDEANAPQRLPQMGHLPGGVKFLGGALPYTASIAD
jgi:hypothetical protein